MNSESQSSEEGKRNGKASLEDALQSDLFNALPASIAQLDGSGVIVTTNSAWKKVATRTPLLHGQNKVGTNYLEDCLKISSREANMAYRAVEGIREVIDGKRPSFWMEYPSGILQTAPRLIWLTVSTLPDGKKGAVIIHNDVTERKEEALAQHESEERFRLIVESVVDYAIVLLNPTGHVISWNIGASRMKGYQANEIMGRHFSIFFLPEDVEDGKPEKGLDIAMSDGRFEDEGWRVRKDGSCFWANVIVTTVRDKSGNLRGFSKVTRDLTAYKDMVDELHASQAELVESQRITHLGSWGWNIQTNEITWSDEQFRLNGFEPGSVQPSYDLFQEIVHPEDLTAVQLAIETSVKTGEPYDITMRVVHPDGNHRYLLVRGEVIYDETGAPLRMLGSSLDITERKDYESALQISDEQFSSAFENAAIGMSLVSLDGHWIKANRALCELLGYSQEELSEMTFQEITHPDDLKDDLKYVHHVLTGEVSSYHMEKRYITKAQEIVWVMLSVSLVRDTYGQPWHFISQIQDITRRKETEAALSLTAERMRLAARAGNVGLWEYDLTDGSLLWDEQMYILYGVDPETAAVGVERWAGSVHPDDRMLGSVHPDDRMLAELKLAESLTEETKPFDAEFRIIRANDKSVRYLRGIGTVIRDQNGNPQRMIGTNWDMTDERQHQEELARALEHERELARQAQAGELAKSEFLAVMSHEIRTPMNGILGFAELLARSPSLTGENKEYADTIMHSGEALLRILDDILDFSRLEAGRLSIEKVIFSPAQIVEDVHALLVQSAKEKGLKMILSVDPNVPEILEGDAGRLRQVLLNLSGNAIKFTERGSVTLRLAPSLDSPEYAEQGIASLDFAVIDTGPGISEEKCSTIFEPFIQADSGISRRYGGSGLGLAISHRLVELMDGEFSVKSKVGRGSEFRITVPFNLPTLDIEPEKPVIEKPLDESFSVLHPLRILVVEDDKINLRLILTFLKKLGYKPLSALNGVEAVKTFREMKPNCILMDIQMPEMDGIAATRSIRHLEKEGEGGAPAFITALTAGTMASDRHRCSDAGMNSFLTKPIKHSLLAQMLSHASHLLENGIERKDS